MPLDILAEMALVPHGYGSHVHPAADLLLRGSREHLHVFLQIFRLDPHPKLVTLALEVRKRCSVPGERPAPRCFSPWRGRVWGRKASVRGGSQGRGERGPQAPLIN